MDILLWECVPSVNPPIFFDPRQADLPKGTEWGGVLWARDGGLAAENL